MPLTTTRHTTNNPYEVRIGYSRAVRRGPFVFVSGTTALDPDSITPGCPEGIIVHADCTAYDEAAVAFREAVKAVEALGGSKGDVVRVRMYVRSDDLGGHRREEVNEGEWDKAIAVSESEDDRVEGVGRAMKEALGDVAPAATMILGVKFVRAEMKVEIELDAVVDESS